MSNTPIDDYINSFPENISDKLKIIKRTIKEIAPDAEEVISYKIACFKINGKYLIYFAGWKNHISMYPIPKGDKKFQKEIERFISGKGTLKFPIDRELPTELIKKVAEFRIEENPKS